MASSRRRTRDREQPDPSASTPAQQDEADIVQEVGAELDPDTGVLVADEEKIREIGALDAESVRDNRRHDEMVNKKRANVKNVPFNVSDVLVLYDQMTRFWPPNSLYVSVKRLTGTPIQQTITNGPRNGQELYVAIQQIHGQNAEASYELTFVDATTKQYRGKGTIGMPDTRGQHPFAQGQSPMNPHQPYGYPPPYPPPPGYPAPAPQAPVSPPGYAPPSPSAMAGMDLNAFLALQKQQFEFWQAQQERAGGSPAGPQTPLGMVIVPGVGYVSTERILQALVGPGAPTSVPTPAAAAPAPQNPQAAQPAAMPPFQPPPGMVFVPGWGMVSMEALANAQAQTAGVPRPPSMSYRPPYGGPRPPYYAGGDAPPPGVAPYNPPQRQKTPAEEFRDAVSIVETAVSIADRFRPPAQQQTDLAPGPDDDNPIRIIDTGPAKVLVNRADGKLRAWETGWANLDKIFKFVSEQADAIRKSGAAGAKEQQAHPQQLPPGYVHVTPGYKPPPGYVVGPPVAVPAAAAPTTQAAPQQQGLPEPPAHMPAPMATPEDPPPRRSWGMPPTMPGDS